MGLQITFNTEGLTADEAIGLMRLLNTVSPHALAHAADAEDMPPARAPEALRPLIANAVVQIAEKTDEPAAPVVDVDAAFGGPTASSAAPPAPGVSPAPSPTIVPGVTVDADGLPWDARIHSGNKETTAEGKWRKRRGVHEETMRLVTEELRATMSAAAPPVTPPTTAPVGTPADGTPPPSPTGQTATSTASPSEPAAPPPPPPAPPAPEPVAVWPVGEIFGELMKVVAPAKNTGKLTDAEITATLQPYGITALGLLMNRPDLVPAVQTTFEAIITAKG